jgi:hypothetical protein
VSGALTEILHGLTGIDAEAAPLRLRAAAEATGLDELVLYLADLGEEYLLPWIDDDAQAPLLIDGTLAGRSYRRGEPVNADNGRWWFPIGDGHQRLGVMTVKSSGDRAQVGSAGRVLAALAGLILVSSSPYCDSITRHRRRKPVTLAAELRWSLMPPRSMSSGRVSVAGVLEPAYEIAGDSFDYALDSGVLNLAVFDAMGHGVTASRLANLAVTAYRHGRRLGLDLGAIYRKMDDTVMESFGEGVFVTGHLARLDIESGSLTVLNAGHPRPLLIRNGSVSSLSFQPGTPVGIGYVTAEVGEMRLQPGDCIVVFSDGLTEAKSAHGEVFGGERVGQLALRTMADGESLPETVRRLMRSVMRHRGVALEDDATVLMFSWQ